AADGGLDQSAEADQRHTGGASVISRPRCLRLIDRTYAVSRTRREEASAMSRAAGVDWGSLHHQPALGRPGHGVAPLSYDAAALRPSGRGAARLARRVGRGG